MIFNIDNLALLQLYGLWIYKYTWFYAMSHGMVLSVYMFLVILWNRNEILEESLK